MSPHVRRAVSAMYLMVDQYDFQDWTGTRYLRRALEVNRKLIPHARVSIRPKPGEFERAKVTSEHHTHFRPEEVWELFELTALVNRGTGSIDWKKEKEHRVRPDVVDVKPADVYWEAVEVFQSGVDKGYKYAKIEMDKFIKARCEEVLKHNFSIGDESASVRVHECLKRMLKQSESFCYDFDDFNAQHSTELMQAVLIAYYNVFKLNMTEDQQRAMEWVIQSVKRMIINNNEGKVSDKYTTKGTLLSGWRLTTFMNTVLNYVYFKISSALDQQGEFLRVEHKVDKEKGLWAQYLTREMATLAHSHIEIQAPLWVVDTVKAMVTRCEKAAHRAEGATARSYELLCLSLKSRHADVDLLIEERIEYEDVPERAGASKESLKKPKTIRPSAPIIEEWESDSEDETVVEKIEVKKTVKHSLEKIEFVNARNTTVENESKAEKPRKLRQSPRGNKRN
nr:hypothetical protein [Tanacetum cinerariifolium]